LSAPELAGISAWLNSRPLTLAELRGKVVFLDFWTYSCSNCLNTIPNVNAIWRRYSGRPLLVIGIHAPEFDFEKDLENVTTAVSKLGIQYPVALDNEHSTWKLYGNKYWPRQTLVDCYGEVRYEHIGEGGYEEIETQVAGLVAQAESSTKNLGGNR
jgi:thiol-disulfide isomerase/thioredoxin